MSVSEKIETEQDEIKDETHELQDAEQDEIEEDDEQEDSD